MHSLHSAFSTKAVLYETNEDFYWFMKDAFTAKHPLAFVMEKALINGFGLSEMYAHNTSVNAWPVGVDLRKENERLVSIILV